MGYCGHYGLAYQYILQQIEMSKITGVPYSFECSFALAVQMTSIKQCEVIRKRIYKNIYTNTQWVHKQAQHEYTSTQTSTKGRKGASFLESVGGGMLWCSTHVTQGTRPNGSHATSPPAHTAMRSLALWKNSTHGLKSFFFPHWAVTCRRSP